MFLITLFRILILVRRTVKWERDVDCLLIDQLICGSFYYGAGVTGPFIFIGDDYSTYTDTVPHEVGHNYMDNATGWWWWNSACWDHTMFTRESPSCAWSEGWGDFVALVTNGDPCYDFGPTPCGGNSYELENQGWGDGHIIGDTVEGRVAGALYDMYDTANDAPYDSASFGLDSIADIVFEGSDIPDLIDFWSRWKASGQNKHHAVKAIFQNTINYNNPPHFSPPLPDREMDPNSVIHVDLWSNTSDEESADPELQPRIIPPLPPIAASAYKIVIGYTSSLRSVGWAGVSWMLVYVMVSRLIAIASMSLLAKS